MSRRQGVLLVGHGTRDPRGTEQFFELAGELTKVLGRVPVRPALLEFQQPTIAQAWEALVAAGVEHIDVAPLLLFAAGHAKQDIPQAIETCRQSTPQVSCSFVRPLSRHRSIVELVIERVEETLDAAKPIGAKALIMVGRGNRDPCAQADMRLLSEVVARRLPFDARYTAFYAMAEPALPDVLSEVAASSDYDTVVLHPHLLFSGRLFEAIRDQVEAASHAHPQTDIRLSRYLGPDLRVAEAIAARVTPSVR